MGLEKVGRIAGGRMLETRYCRGRAADVREGKVPYTFRIFSEDTVVWYDWWKRNWHCKQGSKGTGTSSLPV
eukprot:1189164-Prorocentrum_minimum.AAC.3